MSMQYPFQSFHFSLYTFKQPLAFICHRLLTKVWGVCLSLLMSLFRERNHLTWNHLTGEQLVIDALTFFRSLYTFGSTLDLLRHWIGPNFPPN